ncbi:hypothetical protein TARUN_3037 [Trichoderma arundinaceum]|uniref:Uncharacterized protein n=1 Tax=Trichoderma arundinaceum TaxID=490622 RepID=A0A395NTF5_TRIAR|nr:hypothetical protein TARUN_3037 [Trichoderma arundinaceum]
MDAALPAGVEELDDPWVQASHRSSVLSSPFFNSSESSRTITMSDNAKLYEITRLLVSFIHAIRTYRERELQFLQELLQLFNQMGERPETRHVRQDPNAMEDVIYDIDETFMDYQVD